MFVERAEVEIERVWCNVENYISFGMEDFSLECEIWSIEELLRSYVLVLNLLRMITPAKYWLCNVSGTHVE